MPARGDLIKIEDKFFMVTFAPNGKIKDVLPLVDGGREELLEDRKFSTIPPSHQFTVTSSRSRYLIYVVTRWKSGHVTCSCPGFQATNKFPRYCKHISENTERLDLTDLLPKKRKR